MPPMKKVATERATLRERTSGAEILVICWTDMHSFSTILLDYLGPSAAMALSSTCSSLRSFLRFRHVPWVHLEALAVQEASGAELDTEALSWGYYTLVHLRSAYHRANPTLVRTFLITDTRVQAPARPRFWMYKACKVGRLDIVKTLHRSDFFSVSKLRDHSSHQNPLWLASAHGHTEIAKYLVEQASVSISERGCSGECPWIWESYESEQIEQEFLYDLDGSSVSEDSGSGFMCSPIWVACANGHMGTVKYLHKAGAKLNKLEGPAGESPYLAACRFARLGVLQYLHEEGIDINQRSSDGKNALWLGCYTRNIELIRWCHKNCLDIHSCGFSYSAAVVGELDVRWWGGFVTEALKYLQNNFGIVLDEWILEVYRQHDQPLGTLRTPFWQACYDGNFSTVRNLYLAGADFNKPDFEGLTPIEAAISNNNPDIVRYLYEAGADMTPKLAEKVSEYVLCDDMGVFG
eukprot:gene9103-231_t